MQPAGVAYIEVKLDTKTSLKYIINIFLKPSIVFAFFTLPGSLFQLCTTLLK